MRPCLQGRLEGNSCRTLYRLVTLPEDMLVQPWARGALAFVQHGMQSPLLPYA